MGEELKDRIHKIIFQAKSDLSPMSIKTYTNCIYKIMDEMKTDNMLDLLDYKDVINTIKENWTNPATIKTKMASVIVALKCMHIEKKHSKHLAQALEKYTEVIEENHSIISKGLATSKKTPEEQANWTTKEDKEKLEHLLLEKIPDVITSPTGLKAFRNYIIYLFYTKGIPSRNELADSKILVKPLPKKLSDEYNYIVLDPVNKSIQYIMNVYKTAKAYGQKIIDIKDKSLYPPFVNYYNTVRKFNDEDWFLLNDNAEGKLTRNRLGVIFTRLGKLIGKHLNTSLNRHEAVSNLIPVDKVKELADMMGHSTQEALEVYAKS
jgi:hypothetical protein